MLYNRERCRRSSRLLEVLCTRLDLFDSGYSLSRWVQRARQS